MRTLLLIAALALPAYGTVAPQTTSEKIRTRLMETTPPPAAVVAKPGPVKAPDTDEVVVLRRMVVREAYTQREFNAYMEREKQRAADEKFDPVKGGTLYTSASGRMKVGLWGGTGGWAFLKFNW